ncbi:MAG: ribosome maturation factor RimP [Rickettsiales bacterium]|jgi:ribosome maturation factor RimP|nr:ribosome maturation factor RimP [Rickettsiales bacterium]
MELAKKITDIIEPSLEAMGYCLVQVKLTDQAKRKTLSVMAERSDGTPMSFDDCTEISRIAGALLEVEDPITTAYDLEVCSPGTDRPLTKIEDFSKYCGDEAKIELMIPLSGGRRRMRGMIESVKGNEISVALVDAKETVKIDFANIRSAKLLPPTVAPNAKKKLGKK